MTQPRIHTLSGIVDWIIENSEHTADQGNRFERLMAAFFRTSPVWVEQFSDVWLWNDSPGNNGEADHGVDLVAKNRYDDGYTAIQAKCYSRTTTLNKPEVDSFISASGSKEFTRRILVSTTFSIGDKAKKEMDRQEKPSSFLLLSELEEAGIDWAAWSPDNFEAVKRTSAKTPRYYQEEALRNVEAGLAAGDRGKMIMACGTGKTYTAQLIAEKLVGAGGTVLFLAPSISLVSQTITEWAAEATVPIAIFGVCSDSKVGTGEVADISPYDLVVPSTTDPELLASNFAKAPDTHMKVVFSTYHSSPVISAAQAAGIPKFDLVICDEAHRTTGVQLKDDEAKKFQMVHDDEHIYAAKRLYMTATPRVYKPHQRVKAAEKEAVLSSMDDEVTYGKELFKISFREAVNRGWLTDYKVLILTVEEQGISEAFQRRTASLGEVNLPEAAKMVGCLNALAKRERIVQEGDVTAFAPGDRVPLQRAVAFSNTIKASRHFADEFARIAKEYQYLTDQGQPLVVETDHVDGNQDSVERRRRLDWLKEQPGEEVSRILSNAKCLTEGIDVPSLDAILFLEPRKSQVDIIQAVGRVMRKAPGKEYGYIVVPIAVPPGSSPEAVLKEGSFKAVWQILSALRSHDEDMNRDINQIRLGKLPKNIEQEHFGADTDEPAAETPQEESADAKAEKAVIEQLELEFDVAEFQELCWAQMVQKVGDDQYLKRWAKNIADIAAALEERIRTLSTAAGVKREFGQFVKALQENLNGSIDADDAIAMLAQHLVTRPVFEAIFPDYSLLTANPIAQAMEDMLVTLEDRENLTTEARDLEAFYESVAYHVDGVTDPHARQAVLIELYEEFFKTAFPKQAASLGIVYTPIEVTDFIVHAADCALRTHFDGASLSDEGVHILDPFTGTGTFIVQMLRSGLIKPHDLARKYSSEIHANEIQLLAYYIATVNIETAYHELTGGTGPIQAFPGIVYTDTFQLGENDDRLDLGVFPANSKRADAQNKLDIRVIVGNPPYSSGQKSANDSNQNLRYENLDGSILDSYASGTTATKKNLYDSYVRAIRWASNRVLRSQHGGIVAYVTNNGYIESTSFDGFRKTVAAEFDFLYVFNLRGNQKGDWKSEGGKIFGEGSQTGAAILVLVRSPNDTKLEAEVSYREVQDGLSTEEKLGLLTGTGTTQPLTQGHWTIVKPNSHGDWIRQRSDTFQSLAPLHERGEPSVFSMRSLGPVTSRDRWNYNSSRTSLERTTESSIAFFNSEVDRFLAAHPEIGGRKSDRGRVAESFVDRDPAKFSWGSKQFQRLGSGIKHVADKAHYRTVAYRPFFPQHFNSNPAMSWSHYRSLEMFPAADSINRVILVTDKGSRVPFSVLMVDNLPDSKFFVDSAPGFPRYHYRDLGESGPLFETEVHEMQRVDAISEHAVSLFVGIRPTLSKDDIFYLVYGLLHSRDYRSTFGNDLRKDLPRIPTNLSGEQAWSLSTAGRELAKLHLGYETVEPWGDLIIDGQSKANYVVDKMRYFQTTDPASGTRIVDRSSIRYNDHLSIRNIPLRAQEWRLGARSAIDWILDQWQVKQDKSGLVNNPNDWAAEHNDPAYIVDLLGRVVTVSMRTLDIVDSLPPLNL